MDAQKVDLFIMNNGSKLPDEQLPFLREKLLAVPEDKWSILASVQFKDPVTALLLSLFFGGIGVDRFYLGHTGLGIGKLLTCGGCGVWALIDLFLIMGATRQENLKKLQFYLL